MLTKYHKKPACMTGKCPIGDIAPDERLNDLVDAFIRIEMLDTSPAWADMQRQLLRESGLIDEHPDTLLEMKCLIAQYKNKLK